jgi:hypothetical protein
MPATRVASVRQNFFRLLSPWILQPLRANPQVGEENDRSEMYEFWRFDFSAF